MRQLILILVLLFCVLPAKAAGTYYIDCVNGSDSANGTTTSTPWLHAPGMTGASGNAYAHTPVAGDQFIFRGGITCPVADFPYTVSQSGSAGNVIYIGVSAGWYSGGAWTRPIFDMNYTVVSGNIPVLLNGSYITFDNIEVEHMQNVETVYQGSITVGPSITNVTIQNSYIHDWRSGQLQSDASGDVAGGGIMFRSSGNMVANNNVIGPSQGGDGTNNWCSGTGIYGGDTVTNNAITNACDFVHGQPTVLAGNTFNYGNAPWVTDNHCNVFYGTESLTLSQFIYNNLLIGPFTGCYQGFLVHPCWSGTSSVIYVFNNVFGGLATSLSGVYTSYCPAGNTAGAYFFNNTAFGDGIIDSGGGDHALSFLTIQNNHRLDGQNYPPGNGQPGVFWCWAAGGCDSAPNPVTMNYGANNASTTSTQSAAQGYVAPNYGPPSSSGGATVGYGVNLTSYCTGGVINALCSDRLGNARPASGAWDAGAYQYNSNPAPITSYNPPSLSFGNQITGTSSSPQSISLTNTGNATLTISSIAMQTGTQFSVTNNCGGSVTAGNSCSISVTFTPTTVGAKSDIVVVTSNATGSPDAAAVSGTGTTTAPSTSYSPTSLSFGSQNTSTSSTPQTVTLTNTGNATLSSLSIAMQTGTQFSQTNNCGSSLTAGSHCTISVTFTPTTVGAKTDNVVVTSNAASSPDSVAVAGTGTSSGAATASLVQEVNSGGACPSSGACSIVVASTGAGNFGVILTTAAKFDYVSSITTGGTWTCPAASQYSSNAVGQSMNACYNLSLAGGVTTITVPWTGGPGSHASFDFREYHCTGAGCSVSYDTAGYVDAGTSGSPQTGVALTLGGANDVIAQEIYTNVGAPTSVNSPYGNFVKPNTYYWGLADLENTASGAAPTWPESNSSAISLGAAIAMKLSGTPPAPATSYSPASLLFGKQAVSTSSSATVITLQNTGTATLTVSSIAMQTGTQFAQTNTCSSVSVGNTCSISVTFTPTSGGAKTDNVVVTSNAASSPDSVAVSGIGAAGAPTYTSAPGITLTQYRQSVTLSSSGGTVICWNTTGAPATAGDGATCSTGTVYTAPINVLASEPLYFVAGSASLADSVVNSQAFTITLLPVSSVSRILY